MQTQSVPTTKEVLSILQELFCEGDPLSERAGAMIVALAKTKSVTAIADDIKVDETYRIVERGKSATKLSPTNFIIFKLLLEHYPRTVPVRDVWRAVNGVYPTLRTRKGGEENKERSMNTVRVAIVQTRKCVAPLSIKVQNHQRRGYRLEIEPQE